MISLRGQLARAQAMGGGSVPRMTAGSSSPNPMYVSLRSMQAERQASASALAARRAQLQGEVDRVLSLQASNPEFSAEQNAIDRDYQVEGAKTFATLNIGGSCATVVSFVVGVRD